MILKQLNNENMTVIGIMTGTSMDSIDISICKFSSEINFELIAFEEYDFPEELRTKLNKMIGGELLLKDISQINFYFSYLYYESIKNCLFKNNIHIDRINAIGIHGQTLWHQPKGEKLFANDDFMISSTFQLGSGSVLSNLIGKTVVSNFREADMAMGGEGAPLIPIFDYHFLKSDRENIIALNIGGISNITYLKRHCKVEEVIAFDTGPGNSLIDIAMQFYYNKSYDNNGEVAYRGSLIDSLYQELHDIHFINKRPPKSTGKEDFGIELFEKINNKYFANKKEDIIHTLSLFTAYSIAENIKLFANVKSKIVVSGGGIKNKFIIESLKLFLSQSIIISSDKIGINSSAKESICFAYLAYRTMNKLPSNITSVTGASKTVVLGSISS